MNIEQQLTNISDVIFYENLHLEELKKVKTPFHIIQAKEKNILKYLEQEKELKDIFDKQQQFKDVNGYISLIEELEKENENLRNIKADLILKVQNLEEKICDLEEEIENSDIEDLEEELDDLLVKVSRLEKSNKEKDVIINLYKDRIYDLQEQICGLEEKFWGGEDI